MTDDQDSNPTALDPALGNRAARRSAARRMAAAGSAAVLASAAGGAVVTFTGAVAGAAPTDVTTCADSGAGSLPAAVLYAESHPGPDTITISATCTVGSPVLLTSEIGITHAISIVGPGPANFVVDGGGANRIFNVDSDGDFSLSGVTIQNGYSADDGGGIAIDGAGLVTFTNVVFSGNESDDSGGALYIDSSTDVTITNSIFVDNTADYGGALYLLNNDGDTVVSNSTFAGNEAHSDGGAISVYEHPASFALFNTTITGNTATRYGAAVFLQGLYGDGTFLFNTIADNEGGTDDGFYVQEEDATLTFGGNIVASADNGVVVLVANTQDIVTYDNDFFGTVSGFTPAASDLNVDPQLGVLGDNGGPTPTRALAATSPVIDHGPTAWTTFAGDGFDQRGTPYVRVYGGRSDMGAYEVQPGPAPTPGPAPEPAPEPTFTG